MSLDRFVRAQEGVYDQALAELRDGEKRSHWMWFVFPQVAGLGRSETARFYALADLAEAQAYLADPLLGSRLVESASALLAHRGMPVEAVLGEIDAVKLRSSMTLFDACAPGGVFDAVLHAFFDGARDPETLRHI